MSIDAALDKSARTDPSNPNEVDENDEDNPNNSDDGDDDDEESEFRDPPIGYIRLRPSQFSNIPSTVFFEYPQELNIKREDLSVLEPIGSRRLLFTSHWERICVRNAFHRAGFIRNDKQWTAMWSKHQTMAQMKELNCLQKINHFPASWCVGRKDRLLRTINGMK
eukprot:gene13638-28958_t